MIKNRQSTNRVCACESGVHHALFAFAAYANGCTFSHLNFSLYAANKNNNATKFFFFEAIK